MKPIDKKAQKLQDSFKNAKYEPHQLQRDVRKARKELKKIHSKHVRNTAKNSIKKELSE